MTVQVGFKNSTFKAMKIREFKHRNLRFTLHEEPDLEGHATVTLFIEDEEVKDSKTRIRAEEVNGFFERLQQSITSTIKG
jgi:hypothetical protein